MLVKLCKEEFSLKHLRLEHEEPIVFVLSHWQKVKNPHIYYLIFRWLIALIFLVIFLLSVININDINAPFSKNIKWLIYLTNWGFTVCTLQALLSAILVTLCLVKPKRQSSILKMYKFYWVVNIIATDVAFVITILYWSLLFVPGTNVEVMNFLVHGNNSVLMLIDLFVVAHPVKVVHSCFPMIFGVCYVVFSVIYYAVGGTNLNGNDYIYFILNWNKPGETIAICLATLILVGLIHGLTWLLHKLKVFLNPRTENQAEKEIGQRP